jgi:hypothetical protein
MLVEQSNRYVLGIDTTRFESSSLAFLPLHVPLSSQNNGLARLHVSGYNRQLDNPNPNPKCHILPRTNAIHSPTMLFGCL